MEILARTVHYAHQQGVVHRDLKPSNVLLTREGQPKLCDFGVAKLMAGSTLRTQSGMLVGTPEYMAPEQAVEKGTLGPATDVYALGAVLYAILTGHPPFRGATTFGNPLPRCNCWNQCRRPGPSRPSRATWIPSASNAWKRSRAAVQKRPRAGRGFGPLPGRQAHRPRPVGLTERAWKSARRRTAVAALSAAVLVVAVLGFTGIVWQWRKAVAGRDTARRQWYRANMAAAAAALQMHNNVAARRILDTAPAEFRQWEWHYFHSRLDNFTSAYRAPGAGRRCGLQPGRRPAGFCLRGPHRAVVGGGDRVEMALAREHGESLDAVAFSPDGRRLASGDGNGTVRLWTPTPAPARHMPGTCWPHTGPGLQPGRHAAGLDGHAGGRSLPTLGCGHGKSCSRCCPRRPAPMA